MDTQVLHMNTVEVKRSDIREFQKDLKRMKIRHGPFRRLDSTYHVEIFSPSKASFIKLKYSSN
jgi:ribosome-associated toxin RatA of RatAB toxin-antitoxin module